MNKFLIERFVKNMQHSKPNNQIEYKAIRYASFTVILIGIIIAIIDFLINYYISINLNLSIIIFNIILLIISFMFITAGIAVLTYSKQEYKKLIDKENNKKDTKK